MNFNKDEFHQFRIDFKAALADVEKQYGVTITPSAIKYTADTFTIKVECAKAGVDARRAAFVASARSMGFAPSDYKRTFAFMGCTYKLIGFRPRARLSCIGLSDDNHTFAFDPRMVLNNFVADTIGSKEDN